MICQSLNLSQSPNSTFTVTAYIGALQLRLLTWTKLTIRSLYCNYQFDRLAFATLAARGNLSKKTGLITHSTKNCESIVFTKHISLDMLSYIQTCKNTCSFVERHVVSWSLCGLFREKSLLGDIKRWLQRLCFDADRIIASKFAAVSGSMKVTTKTCRVSVLLVWHRIWDALLKHSLRPYMTYADLFCWFSSSDGCQCFDDCQTKYWNVELFPVGLITGTTPRAADASCAGPHFTNKFVGAILAGVFVDPDGRGFRHRSSGCAAVRWSPPGMHPLRSYLHSH